jgi:hypothetical protein
MKFLHKADILGNLCYIYKVKSRIEDYPTHYFGRKAGNLSDLSLVSGITILGQISKFDGIVF